ncbi:DUF6985 domain-containing protein [Aquimarina algicola]|uniref:DUF6985 domain-containing protein n=1 Tax=Aquimarina algicola TaxID=2589995 RepID=A0A504J9Z9_9FLAO|nr:hypothetical protein [Aquimarina algicola]TPN83490.1 hypothetical protein FHK87_19935 [Aquimarina algicola]
MTREEILINSIWTDAKMKVFSSFFNTEITVNLYAHPYSLQHVEGPIISEKMVQTINDVLQLDASSLPLMKSLLYKHCLECCDATSYGFEVKDGETETEANLREFGIKNEDDAFANANLNYINIEDDEVEKRKNRYAKLVFYPEWEEEHGCELILKNGVLLDHYGESDTWLTQFE